MTAFILASGPFTGAAVWDEVAAGLRAAGAQVLPAALAGAEGAEGAGADLEAHIEEVVRLIDSLDAADAGDAGDAPDASPVVLVGHDYGIHPVLGAAARRSERVARIVYLDAGLPQDGDAPLALVPDPGVHALLSGQPDALVPPPEGEEWQRWGSTAGLSAQHLDRLSALAAPQPGRTLTQPLRLTGSIDAVPTSGILCTAGGTTIAAVQNLVSYGPPQFRWLADPRIGFFELATGHWPMLSEPQALAGALLSAAAGEGRRLDPPKDAPEGAAGRPQGFLLDVPECPRERIGRVDLHLPDGGAASGPRPAIVFVHGGPLPRDMEPGIRDAPLYLCYARLAVSLGVVGAVVAHRLHALTDFPTAAADVAEAVETVRSDPRVDADRVALWFFSGGGLLTTDWLAAPPSWLRCLAASYPLLAPLPAWLAVDPHFRPADALHGATRLPLVLTRAGLEGPDIAATVADFLTAAKDAGVAVDIVDVPNGHHAFEHADQTDESRAAVLDGMRAVLAYLEG
ncbi:acetyl esterase/lipase [Streptacidiphilus sp. BW17]|uniref:alpha/beta hydrolase n=1 Tax=Streptacidiphilus sp. BW17 TaxID=3156274 RepID=UPI0035154F94